MINVHTGFQAQLSWAAPPRGQSRFVEQDQKKIDAAPVRKPNRYAVLDSEAGLAIVSRHEIAARAHRPVDLADWDL